MGQVVNPYAVAAGSTSGNAVMQSRSNMNVESSRVIAEVQASVMLAKKFPRSPQRSMDRILNECQRVSLAEKALYSYARGGTDITGPSIRLAEVIARNWENIDFGIKELSQENGQSEMMAYAWDLETNVRQVKVFTVRHIRHTKKGAYDLEDPRDIYEVAANNGARRLRACILGIIPGDVVEAAVSQSEETLIAKADTSPEAIKRMVDAFAAFGVPKEAIEKRIQRRMDAITPAQIISLRKIYTSIKDEMSTAADWFEIDTQAEAAGNAGEKPKTGTEALKAALKGPATPAVATASASAAVAEATEALEGAISRVTTQTTAAGQSTSPNQEQAHQESHWSWLTAEVKTGKKYPREHVQIMQADLKARGIDASGTAAEMHTRLLQSAQERAKQTDQENPPEPPLQQDPPEPDDTPKPEAATKPDQSEFLELQEFYNEKFIDYRTRPHNRASFDAAMKAAGIGPGSRPSTIEQARSFKAAYQEKF